MLEQGKECEESPASGEKNDRGNVEGTDHNPHSLYPCTAGGEDGENLGVNLNPEIRGMGRGKVFLRFGFIYHYLTLI